MKTVEIIRFTGEMEEIEKTVKNEAGKDVKQIFLNPVTEIAKEYECEDGEENSLLSRARLTAELYNRDEEGDFQARIQA